ncbi:MAG TPA: cyclic nucleotide-binding domain-containing protein [Trebonia sp.]|nr:cyclic nucleotide-binding domain-containing protein [Trebonia sp.]
MTEVTAQALGTHPFLRGMSPGHLAALAESATDVVFPAGHRILAEGGYAARFWLIRSGSVALDMLVAGEGPVVIDTVGIGGLVGWSWLFPPYQWAFGAVCVSPVEVFELDAPAVRSRCAADPALGYDLTTRLARVLAGRLQVTRTRLITRSRDGISGQ